MARLPKLWYRKERQSWFVILNGLWHDLGPDKKDAQRRFHQLMREPQKAKLVSSHSLAYLIDEFLDWMQKNRAPSNFEAHRFRLQKFIERWPNLTPEELRPFHVEKWANSYPVSRTTRRNYLRAVKRMMR